MGLGWFGAQRLDARACAVFPRLKGAGPSLRSQHTSKRRSLHVLLRFGPAASKTLLLKPNTVYGAELIMQTPICPSGAMLVALVHLSLVAGTNLQLCVGMRIGFCMMTGLSADGHCKIVDASADGFARGD